MQVRGSRGPKRESGAPERAPDLHFMERTTRFELATLTLATCPVLRSRPLNRAFVSGSEPDSASAVGCTPGCVGRMLARSLAQGADTELDHVVTYDDRMAAAARVLGMRVTSPASQDGSRQIEPGTMSATAWRTVDAITSAPSWPATWTASPRLGRRPMASGRSDRKSRQDEERFVLAHRECLDDIHVIEDHLKHRHGRGIAHPEPNNFGRRAIEKGELTEVRVPRNDNVAVLSGVVPRSPDRSLLGDPAR